MFPFVPFLGRAVEDSSARGALLSLFSFLHSFGTLALSWTQPSDPSPILSAIYRSLLPLHLSGSLDFVFLSSRGASDSAPPPSRDTRPLQFFSVTSFLDCSLSIPAEVQ